MSIVDKRVAYKASDYKSDIKPIWCPGCGDYHVLLSFSRAFAELALPLKISSSFPVSAVRRAYRPTQTVTASMAYTDARLRSRPA